MTNVLIIGFGEIGQAMHSLLSDFPDKFTLYKKDIEDLQVDVPIDIMHICIPFLDNFHTIVVGYIRQYQPKLTIINSTVSPGTTDKIVEATQARVVHSPVRGRHPGLKEGLVKFVKFVGGEREAAEEAKQHFAAMNVEAEIMSSAKETELGKLLSTTYYAVNIAFHQEMDRLCEKHGAKYKEAVTRFNETCTMDINHKIPRPLMFPGIIGGHCLLPNIKILQKENDSSFLKTIVESNEDTKHRAGFQEGDTIPEVNEKIKKKVWD